MKPENTLVASDGHVMLSDFGVSKRMRTDTVELRHHSSTDTQVGTVDYMSPEQIRGLPYS